VRDATVGLCDPLSNEDMVVQVAEEASPAKWHLAHTTWFFETLVLEEYEPGFQPYDETFRVLFNSYYRLLGERHPRRQRGLLTRPGVGEVLAYRDTVDERIVDLLRGATGAVFERLAPILRLGLNHEQQHQELLLTDIKLLLHANPLQPSYLIDAADTEPSEDPGPMRWIPYEAGVTEIGRDSAKHENGFAYDNETPRHRRFLEAFELASRLVTNGEFAEFISDGGYKNPALWLDDAWAVVQNEGWSSPLYWRRDSDNGWSEFTLSGRRPIDPNAPVSHLSFFEADAYARWASARLPTEAEWEHAAGPQWDRAMYAPGFLESGALSAPGLAPDPPPVAQLAGALWQWTRSAHEPYPGYAPPMGAIGEYTGKFMNGQYVLRGGSFATPRDHIRVTYRNFFPPAARWQFAGLRLARTPDTKR